MLCIVLHEKEYVFNVRDIEISSHVTEIFFIVIIVSFNAKYEIEKYFT